MEFTIFVNETATAFQPLPLIPVGSTLRSVVLLLTTLTLISLSPDTFHVYFTHGLTESHTRTVWRMIDVTATTVLVPGIAGVTETCHGARLLTHIRDLNPWARSPARLAVGFRSRSYPWKYSNFSKKILEFYSFSWVFWKRDENKKIPIFVPSVRNCFAR